MTRVFRAPNAALKIGGKALALAGVMSMALALSTAHAQTAKRPSREEIYQACAPEIQRSMAEAKATTPKYLLDALYEHYVQNNPSQAYLLSLLPGLREQAAKFPDGQAPADACTVELVTGQR
jgi:hypothetical protein